MFPSGKDTAILAQIESLAKTAATENIGDILIAALDLSSQIESSQGHQSAEFLLSQIRPLARNAEIGWRLFEAPPHPSHELDKDEIIKLITIVATLHSFCYGVERLDEASAATGASSTPVRFYINSIYHYISALYLLDKEKKKKKLPMGGMVFKVLEPMGLANLLDEIRILLDKSMGEDITFGETVRIIRNKFLVHGNFSPEDIAPVVKRTQMRDFNQINRLAQLIWNLFHQSLILKLKLIAVLTASGVDLDQLEIPDA
jgi:hypothetical protein